MARETFIIPEILQAEQYRRSAERVNLFNAASGGTIILDNQPAVQAAGGEYTHAWRFKAISSLFARMNHASSSALSPSTLALAKGSSVRQKQVGAVKITDDEIDTQVPGSPEAFSTNVGVQFADYQLIRVRNLLIAAAVAAVDSADTPTADCHILDVARGKTAGAKVKLTMAYLNTLLGKMADAREDIKAFIIPSALFSDLIGDQVANFKVDTILAANFVNDLPVAYGRKVIVADVPALTTAMTSNYYSKYTLLGLGEGALRGVVVKDTGVRTQRDILAEVAYTFLRYDFDVDLFIRGMKWAPNSATPNPTDAELATAANWDEDYEDHRQFPIVKGVFNAS